MNHPPHLDDFRLNFPEAYRLLSLGISRYREINLFGLKIPWGVRATIEQQWACLRELGRSTDPRALEILNALATPTITWGVMPQESLADEEMPGLPCIWLVCATFPVAKPLGALLVTTTAFVQPGFGIADRTKSAAFSLSQRLGANPSYRKLLAIGAECAGRNGVAWQPPDLASLLLPDIALIIS